MATGMARQRAPNLPPAACRYGISGPFGLGHLDNLKSVVFAKGREMISDLGYTHNAPRPCRPVDPALHASSGP